MTYTIPSSRAIPGFKNAKKVTRKGGIYTDSSIKKWMEGATWELKAQRKQTHPAPVHLDIVIYQPDLRRRDSDNQVTTILDCLVGARIIEDDKWTVNPSRTLICKLDRGNPRAEITVRRAA